MLLFLSLTGIILSIILLVFNARKYPSSLYLGGFFFLVSLYSFVDYALFYSKSVFLASICLAQFAFLTYLIGPMLFWYVRSVLTDNARLIKKDLWHFLPALIYLVSLVPYMLLPWSQKVANAELLVSNVENLKLINTSLFYDFLPQPVVFMSRPALVLIYGGWSAWILIRWIIRKGSSAVLSQQRYMIQWLIVLLGFLFILTLSHLVAMAEAYRLHDLKAYFTLSLLQLFSGIGLTGLLISPLFFPAILYGLPRIPEPPSLQQLGEQAKIPVNELEKEKQKVEFETDYLQLIARKVDHCMKELQPYLQPDCNLAYMAKLTGIPAHHLAYYFREEKQQLFNDFRNEWRVGHAKKLIREGKARELTLEAIGLLSGFSNRNTFYTSFKKVEGVSPSAYKWEE